MQRTLSWLPLLAVGAFSACAAGKAPEAVATEAPSTGSPGARCVAEAAAPRERRNDEPSQIGVKHILVKHVDSQRAAADITRSREEACLRALEALEKLKGGGDFDEVVAEYSDEEGAATRGGSLGSIRREDVDPAFADAAFLLELNAVSYVVESKFGFHVILRSD